MSATAAGCKAFISVGTTLRQGSEFYGEAGQVRLSSALFCLLAASTEHTLCTAHPLIQAGTQLQLQEPSAGREGYPTALTLSSAEPLKLGCPQDLPSKCHC